MDGLESQRAKAHFSLLATVDTLLIGSATSINSVVPERRTKSTETMGSTRMRMHI